MAEIVVADTGPLIALGRIGRIDLLGRVFERAIVPRVVFDETQFHSDRADARAIFSGHELRLFVVDETPVQPQEFPDGDKLGPGETAAIALAASHGYGVLIDEKPGRSVASAIGLRVIGTVGVLVIARKLGYVPVLKPLLQILASSGYYLSAGLLESALRNAGE